MSGKTKSKKGKSKISKLIEESDSDNDENVHELSFYMNDRVKLMKEVLKIIKPKKIKSMAPDCLKDLDIKEINSMLLEELLGISNKRLKYIFNGQNLEEESSSTDPEEEEKQPDIISLDDISDDDFVVEVNPKDKSKSRKRPRVKEEPKAKKIKKIKEEKTKKDAPLEENLMSVLELLELQARARAIRSQLLLEASNKKNSEEEKNQGSGDDDDVIIEDMKQVEIVINSSESECENDKTKSHPHSEVPTNKKITLIRDRFEKNATVMMQTTEPVQLESETAAHSTTELQQTDHNEDEIILIVDQEEMDGMMRE